MITRCFSAKTGEAAGDFCIITVRKYNPKYLYLRGD